MTSQNVCRWAGIFGVASCILAVIEFPLWMAGGPPRSFWDISGFADYVAKTSGLYLTRTLLDMFIFVFLLVFFAGFRHVIQQARPEQEWLATLFFGAGVVYIALTLVSDSLTGGIALDTIGQKADPTVIRALTEGTILMFGSVGLILLGFLLVLAAYATLATKALPGWTGWTAFIGAVLTLAFVPSMYCGNDPTGFYTASGLGPAVGATFPLLIWILVASLSMIRKRQPIRTDALKNVMMRPQVSCVEGSWQPIAITLAHR